MPSTECVVDCSPNTGQTLSLVNPGPPGQPPGPEVIGEEIGDQLDHSPMAVAGRRLNQLKGVGVAGGPQMYCRKLKSVEPHETPEAHVQHLFRNLMLKRGELLPSVRGELAA